MTGYKEDDVWYVSGDELLVLTESWLRNYSSIWFGVMTTARNQLQGPNTTGRVTTFASFRIDE